MVPPQLKIARGLLTLNALITGIGAYAADWSDSHVFNPKWTPHAKFHNGQTMSSAAALASLTLYYTWRRTPYPKDSLFTASVLGSLYYLTAIR